VHGGGLPQRGQGRLGAQRALAQCRGALVEEDRVDALYPGGVLAAQVVVGLQQRPALQDLRGRDPAFRQPALSQQLPQVPGIGLIGLGVPFAAAGESGVGRLADVRRDAGRGQFLAESAWSAVPALPLARFSRPLAEPAVRLSTQRALHGSCRQGCSGRGQGLGTLLPR
jgi:hypothetical protein